MVWTHPQVYFGEILEMSFSSPSCYGPGSKRPECASEEQLADGGGGLRGREAGEFAMGALVLPLFAGVRRVGATRPDDGAPLDKQ